MVRHFFLSLNVLNGLLALAVVAVVYFAVIPLLNPIARISLPRVKGTTASSGEQKTSPQRFPATDYTVISAKNLFHPERKIPPEKHPEKAIPKPDVYLYGTLITDGASYAFIEDKKAPYSTPGRGKRQTTLKKGDRLSGYTLGEIEANRIVLVKGEERVVVMLDDREKKRSSETPAVPTAARTATGGITPSPPAPSPSPQTMPSSAPAVVSSGPGIAGSPTRPSPQLMPPSAQEATPSKPGIGASGTWPPTKSSIEQTRQKIQEGREMRARQLQRAQ